MKYQVNNMKRNKEKKLEFVAVWLSKTTGYYLYYWYGIKKGLKTKWAETNYELSVYGVCQRNTRLSLSKRFYCAITFNIFHKLISIAIFNYFHYFILIQFINLSTASPDWTRGEIAIYGLITADYPLEP